MTASVGGGRYDRQMRLWGWLGQEYFESATVLAFGAGTEIQETLKNLVLPGVHKVVIYDDVLLSTADVGNSLLIEGCANDAIRGVAVARGLQRLNPEVEIKAADISESLSPIELLDLYLSAENGPDTLLGTTKMTPFPEIMKPIVLIGTEHQSSVEKYLAYITLSRRKKLPPLILMSSYAFWGALRIVSDDHASIDDHERDDEVAKALDLRIWQLPSQLPSLQKILEDAWSEALSSCANDSIGFVPWIVLLARIATVWRKMCPGTDTPPSRDQALPILESLRSELTIEAQKRSAARGTAAHKDETEMLNFQEATSKLHLLSRPSVVWPTPEMKEYLNATDLSIGSLTRFHVFVKALDQFYSHYQRFPLSGQFPDMNATSAKYAELRGAYEGAAASDADALMSIVTRICGDLGLDDTVISHLGQYCRYFIRNCRALRFKAKLESPGDIDDEGISILKEMKAAVESRSENAMEAHLAGAFVGALAAQEVSKLLAKQWIPRLNETLVWNGYNNMLHYVSEEDTRRLYA